MEVEIAELRRRDQFERDTVLAWQVNRIHVQTHNDKRLPSLAYLLEPQTKPQPGQRPSLAHQKAMLQRISTQYGIPIRPVKGGVVDGQ